jgi:GH15 family glucan-1,4-alpha-glucosidase
VSAGIGRQRALASIGPDDCRYLTELARRSHAVIGGHQDPGGAYPASPGFSAYRGYAWLRDGAFTAEGMSRYGDVRSADRFHDWVSRLLVDRRDQVSALVARAAAGAKVPIEEMLPTRFGLDGANGADPWWDFQTDGYGTWLWSIVTHARRHGNDLERWRGGIEVATDYVTAFWSLPCYDWWEEHVEQRHVSTLGAIYGGLRAVADSGLLDSRRAWAAAAAAASIRAEVLRSGVSAPSVGPAHLVKWLGSPAVDGSLSACVVPFSLVGVEDPLAWATLDAIRKDLDVEGGVHRFRDDVFYGGGQWILLTCLLGWNEAAAGDPERAVDRLRWVADHADASGELPEQVRDHLLHPRERAAWVERWGEVASPLLWSHGMYLILADEIGLLPEPEAR